jgi:glutamate--cysteine ligase
MSTKTAAADLTPMESFADLAAYLEAGCKPKDRWRIGTEHEKFGFHTDTLTPIPYDTDRGVRAMLEGLQHRFGWAPVMEKQYIIGLKQPDEEGGGTVSLEPGGQFELSGAPLETLHQTCDEVNAHLTQVREVGDELGIGFLGLGFSPKWTIAETPMMPKGRYRIMRDYMGKKGNLGRDMMFRSCTVQVNLDFASEADMVRKMRVGLALQPIVTAMFANSPFTEGKPNGYQSFRSEIWRDTDPDRTGMLPFVFEDGFGFEAYADYAVDVPMYFLDRDHEYHDVSGKSFRDLMGGRLEGFAGVRPTADDWADHLTTIFPEVRLKRFIEMRGADGGPWRRLCALPAVWTGLLYDQSALDAAWDLVKDWTEEERQALRDQVPRTALATPFRSTTVLEVARAVLAIAQSGLTARHRLDGFGDDEVHFLNAIATILEDGRTPAEELLDLYEGEWNGDIDRIFSDCAY